MSWLFIVTVLRPRTEDTKHELSRFVKARVAERVTTPSRWCDWYRRSWHRLCAGTGTGLPNRNFEFGRVRGVDFGLGLASSKDDPKAARDNIANIGRSLAKAGVAAHEDRIMYRLKQRAAAIGQPS
ncbi:hypothetical protein ASD03_35390 [Ensifer sp. Root127]|nr:hypothetical protein ASD03_35390 [Ensifer sp. Root127]